MLFKARELGSDIAAAVPGVRQATRLPGRLSAAGAPVKLLILTIRLTLIAIEVEPLSVRKAAAAGALSVTVSSLARGTAPVTSMT